MVSTPRVPGGPGSGDPLRDQIVETVERLHSELGYWPSQKAVRETLKLSKRLMQYHVRILIEAGRVERLHNGRVLRALPAPPEEPVAQ